MAEENNRPVSYYQRGIIKLAKGSDIVVGTNTSWLTSNDCNISLPLKGNLLTIDKDSYYPIDDVISDTEIRLAWGYQGADEPTTAYAILTSTFIDADEGGEDVAILVALAKEYSDNAIDAATQSEFHAGSALDAAQSSGISAGIATDAEEAAEGFMVRAETAAVAAEASEEAAAESETNAGSSEVNAAESETNAAASEVAAGLSEISAEEDANRAETEADRAEGYANSLDDAIRNLGTFDPNSGYPTGFDSSIPNSWFSNNTGDLDEVTWGIGDLLVWESNSASFYRVAGELVDGQGGGTFALSGSLIIPQTYGIYGKHTQTDANLHLISLDEDNDISIGKWVGADADGTNVDGEAYGRIGLIVEPEVGGSDGGAWIAYEVGNASRQFRVYHQGYTEGLALDADVTNLQSQIDSNDTDISNNATAIAGLDTRLTDAEADIVALESLTSTHTTDIADNTSDISTNTAAIAGLDTRVTEAESDISSLQTLTSSHTAAIAENTSNIADNTADIASHTTRITEAETDILALEQLTSSNSSAIADNTSDISDNATGIANNVSDIAANTANIATNTSDISGNATAISVNTTAIASILSDVGSLQSAIVGVQLTGEPV